MTFSFESARTAAVITFFILALWQLPILFIDSKEAKETKKEYDSYSKDIVLVSQSPEAVAKLLSKFIDMQNRDQNKDESENKPVVEEKVIDKTLRPFFAMYDEQHQIGLSGTFFELEAFAVLQLINFESQQVTFHQVKVNDAFGPYTLSVLEKGHVILTNGNEQLVLNLFNKQK